MKFWVKKQEVNEGLGHLIGKYIFGAGRTSSKHYHGPLNHSVKKKTTPKKKPVVTKKVPAPKVPKPPKKSGLEKFYAQQ